MFSVKKFIEDVKSYKELYDKKNLYYCDISRKNRIWQKLNEKYGIDAKTKWTYLRDKYVREKRKVSQSSGSRWDLFPVMDFLDGIIQPPRSRHKNPPINPNDSLIMKIEVGSNQSRDNYYASNSFSDEETHESNISTEKPCDVGYEGSNNSLDNNEQTIYELNTDLKEIIRGFDKTVETYKNILRIQSQRTEDDNFGILVSEILSTLTLKQRSKAKGHIMQFLAQTHLNQISED